MTTRKHITTAKRSEARKIATWLKAASIDIQPKDKDGKPNGNPVRIPLGWLGDLIRQGEYKKTRKGRANGSHTKNGADTGAGSSATGRKEPDKGAGVAGCAEVGNPGRGVAEIGSKLDRERPPVDGGRSPETAETPDGELSA